MKNRGIQPLRRAFARDKLQIARRQRRRPDTPTVDAETVGQLQRLEENALLRELMHSWPDVPAYADPNDPGNSPAYQTGKPCIEGCGRPAGTRWSPLWCFECNAARIYRITKQLREIDAAFSPLPHAGDGA